MSNVIMVRLSFAVLIFKSGSRSKVAYPQSLIVRCLSTISSRMNDWRYVLEWLFAVSTSVNKCWQYYHLSWKWMNAMFLLKISDALYLIIVEWGNTYVYPGELEYEIKYRLIKLVCDSSKRILQKYVKCRCWKSSSDSILRHFILILFYLALIR